MSFDPSALREAIEEHGRVARVVIAGYQGSSPREAGTSMLVWDDSNGIGQSGTIGGGALEFEAARVALSEPGVKRIPLGPALGQCCGGAVTLVTEVFDAVPQLDGLFVRRVEGAQDMPLFMARAGAQARNGTGAKITFQNGWLAEPVAPARAPLWIWGAGHVGRALVDVIGPLGQFDITWVDSAADRFPARTDRSATPLVAVEMPDAVRFAPTDAHHLIVTYSHAFDLEICHRLLAHRFASTGLIGSATKWTRFRSRLRSLGHTDAQISRICCPIGQPELGKHPQAIAIGVASGLLLSLQTGTLGKDVAV